MNVIETIHETLSRFAVPCLVTAVVCWFLKDYAPPWHRPQIGSPSTAHSLSACEKRLGQYQRVIRDKELQVQRIQAHVTAEMEENTLDSTSKAIVHFTEEFDKDWQGRWVETEKKDSGVFKKGSFQWRAGTFHGEKDRDKGLQTSQHKRHYAISAKFKPFSNEGQALVIQYTVQQRDPSECDGTYIALFRRDMVQETLGPETSRYVEFGPDTCDQTRTVHIRLSHGHDKYLVTKQIPATRDQYTHLYTLILKPGGKYVIMIDNKQVATGTIADDLNPEAPSDLHEPIFHDIGAIGFEFHQWKSGTTFDNILVTNDVDLASQFGLETWGRTRVMERKKRHMTGDQQSWEANVHVKEDFSGNWSERWTHSSYYAEELMQGRFKLPPDTSYIESEMDRCLKIEEHKPFFGISADIVPFSNLGHLLVVQFSMKHEQALHCTLGFVSLHEGHSEAHSLHMDSPFHIQFGSYECRENGVRHIHFLHSKLVSSPIPQEKMSSGISIDDVHTHIYTLIIQPDNVYQVKIDNQEVATGNLGDSQRLPVSDHLLYRFNNIGSISVQVWQGHPGTLVDNILVTDDEVLAEKLAQESMARILDLELKWAWWKRVVTAISKLLVIAVIALLLLRGYRGLEWLVEHFKQNKRQVMLVFTSIGIGASLFLLLFV